MPKQKYKLEHWAQYNAALHSRGDITVWLSKEAISQWYVKDRVYDGTGAPTLFTDFAIPFWFNHLLGISSTKIIRIY